MKIQPETNKIMEGVTLDEERALYGSKNLLVKGVSFDGPADGESALKECSDIQAENCFCNLRYPFWHIDRLKIIDTEMTSLCRAALWYSNGVQIVRSKLHGIKAVRECKDVSLEDCDIISPEFGWFTRGLELANCRAEGEYFLMHSQDVVLKNVKFIGKYSFQYVKNAVIENCELNTKDAFWHAENITVKNSIVAGEYLGWYSKNLTFENCVICGTQPLCYCKGLKLINCKTEGCDLSFEKSEVEATLTTPVLSIKNAYKGKIVLPSVGEIIRDDPKALCEVIIKNV